MKTKKVLVCGDLIWDTHIVKTPLSVPGAYQSDRFSYQVSMGGGAWYLRNVARMALESAGVDATVSAPKEPSRVEVSGDEGPNGVAKATSVWSWFPDDNSPAWRVAEFLGCPAPRWDTSKVPRHAGVKTKGRADVLLIDDHGVGFASHPKAWPECLEKISAAPASIIAKSFGPFDKPLWNRLLDKPWAERLTLVVGAPALRREGARLEPGLSWDRTIEEVKDLIKPGGVCWRMRFCKRLVIMFGRSGAAVFSRWPRSPGEAKGRPNTLNFERFVFDPAHLEQTWSWHIKGSTYGSSSLLTAFFMLQELALVPPSTHLTVSRGLNAARLLHLHGGGDDEELGLNLKGVKKTRSKDGKKVSRGPSVEKECLQKALNSQSENLFRSAFDDSLLDVSPSNPKGASPGTLLADRLGNTEPFLMTAAEEIVRSGTKEDLREVPYLEFGKEDYFTVDREEVECLNGVRNVIEDYRRNPEDRRPLSIAVFGQPGSGKSYAIKRLAKAVFGDDKGVLEFNLSQFPDVAALHDAFHEVRDKSVKGQMPLVFWDEFDTASGTRLGWLKEFLAPMQDSEFVSKGKAHPFGKCIFIFAGGTCTTYDEFNQTKGDFGYDKFKEAKGPDFVSRLRGFVNIKGPNRLGAADKVHVIRRALSLRSLILRYHKAALQHHDGSIEIHPAVLSAFLRVKEYNHGTRSMEAIVSLSRVRGGRHFGPSELPPKEVVKLHVTSDFLDIVENREETLLDQGAVRRVAALLHEKWVKAKKRQGWSKSEDGTRDADQKLDYRLVPYDELSDADKQRNIRPARLTLMRLESLGYRVCRPDMNRKLRRVRLTRERESLHQLAIAEHERWMRERLVSGIAYAPHTQDALLLHRDICKFNQLPKEEQKLDHSAAQAIQEFFDGRGLEIVKERKTSTAPKKGAAKRRARTKR